MLKVLGRATSTNVQKVLWFCDSQNRVYEHDNDIGGAFGRNDSPEYLAMNPNGRVPVVIDGDFVMWESNSIIRYLARQSKSDLYPSDFMAPSDRRTLDGLGTVPARAAACAGLHRHWSAPSRKTAIRMPSMVHGFSGTLRCRCWRISWRRTSLSPAVLLRWPIYRSRRLLIAGSIWTLTGLRHPTSGVGMTPSPMTTVSRNGSISNWPDAGGLIPERCIHRIGQGVAAFNG